MFRINNIHSVVDPDVQIRGGRGGHPDPEIRGGSLQKLCPIAGSVLTIDVVHPIHVYILYFSQNSISDSNPYPLNILSLSSTPSPNIRVCKKLVL